jgi:hypothetical protein
LPERGGVDERDVALDEFRERGLGMARGVFGQQFGIGHCLHSIY